VAPAIPSIFRGAYTRVSLSMARRSLQLACRQQVLEKHAQQIASRYTADKAALYKVAAQTLRIPYWDWAVDATLPPPTTQPEIVVNNPGGRTTIPNPLYSFTWPRPLKHDPDWFPTSDDPRLWNYSDTQRPINGDNSASKLGLDNNQLRDQVESRQKYSHHASPELHILTDLAYSMLFYPRSKTLKPWLPLEVPVPA
jgi:hypothetical protein